MEMSELLWFGLIIAALAAFNYAIQRAARAARRERSEPQDEPAAAASPVAEPMLDYAWGRVPGAMLEPYERPASVPLSIDRPVGPADIAAPPLRPHVRKLLHSRRELQHAVVLMTVLGPCRAIEPHDRRD